MAKKRSKKKQTRDLGPLNDERHSNPTATAVQQAQLLETGGKGEGQTIGSPGTAKGSKAKRKRK